MVCSTILFHTCLSSISTLQPIIFILQRSSSTWSIHLNLGLPSGLVLYGFHSVNKLEILPLYSQYIYSISIFVIKNKHLFYTNNQIHSTHTRFKTNLHPPTANLTKFQKAVYYSAIKIFNNLPHEIKDLAIDLLPFRNALKRVLLANSFYNSKEYFNYRRRSIEI